MTTSGAGGTNSSIGEEFFPLCFSDWIKHRRQELNLTQAQLAMRASCSVFAIRKIEMGDRRPSRQLAELLAKSLEIPSADLPVFIKVARGELNVERLLSPARASSMSGKPAPMPGNLPRELTPFIGREAELTALTQMLQDPQCSLLTIAGPGGIGKSRLAVEAARRSTGCFTDGVWFVSLAGTNSPAFLVPTIAEAVHCKFQEPTDPQTQLLRYLRAKKMLLILDNAEHLLEGASLFIEILNACLQVKLLVTSRVRLNLLSEWVFEVQGLPVPANDQEEQFETYSAVALFLQCARRVQAGFELREGDRSCVLKICQILEGMPLGIELAAAWVGLLPCEAIAREIERNIDFLTVSMRDLPERHRSLRATVDHSWKLLNAEEQVVLSRLSVFHGSFRRESAEEVCDTSLAVLASLRDKMLLYRTDENFFHLHEFIRTYARERLEASGEAPEIHRRHAASFAALADAAKTKIRGPEQSQWLERLEQDYGNIRAALDWSTHPSHHAAEIGLRLCAALGIFWDMHGHASEGRQWLRAALDLPAPSSTDEEPNAQMVMEAYIALRTKVLVASGALATLQGDYEAALSYAREALLLCQQTGNKTYMATCLMNLGNTQIHLGDYAQALVLHEQALALRRELEDKPGIALSLVNLGFAAMSRGDFPSARAFLLECVSLRRELGDKFGIALALGNLGEVAIEEQDLAGAQPLLEESLNIRREIGDDRGIAFCLIRFANIERARRNYARACDLYREGLSLYRKVGDRRAIASALQERAELYANMGQIVPAVRLWSSAVMLCQSLGAPIPPSHRNRYEQALAHARGELGDEKFQQAWAEGGALNFDQAIDSLISDSDS